MVLDDCKNVQVHALDLKLEIFFLSSLLLSSWRGLGLRAELWNFLL